MGGSLGQIGANGKDPNEGSEKTLKQGVDASRNTPHNARLTSTESAPSWQRFGKRGSEKIFEKDVDASRNTPHNVRLTSTETTRFNEEGAEANFEAL